MRRTLQSADAPRRPRAAAAGRTPASRPAWKALRAAGQALAARPGAKPPPRQAGIFAGILAAERPAPPATSRNPAPRSQQQREYRRLIERLDGCTPRGWGDAWLAAAGAGAGLFAAALATALALARSTYTATRSILWMLVLLGGAVFTLALGAYATQRRGQIERITELRKDMEIHMRKTTSNYREPHGS
jgi:hypothetical protein